jgi:dephospho-CoA kinase
VRRVLITGMSGTGKSSVIRELSRLGLRAIDTDWDPEWERPTAEGEWIWREDRIQALLADEDTDLLVVSACVSNQGRFYDCFDAVVLLSATEAVTLRRLALRTTNPYGKSNEEAAEVLRNKQAIEPLLRKRATVEIETSTLTLAEVVDKVLAVSCGRHSYGLQNRGRSLEI